MKTSTVYDVIEHLASDCEGEVFLTGLIFSFWRDIQVIFNGLTFMFIW